jgi:hypothetical protein
MSSTPHTINGYTAMTCSGITSFDLGSDIFSTPDETVALP